MHSAVYISGRSVKMITSSAARMAALAAELRNNNKKWCGAKQNNFNLMKNLANDFSKMKIANQILSYNSESS